MQGRGGLLLGTVRTNNIEITDFEPFRPDRAERHFVLSGAEKELLGLSIQNGRRDAQSSVVGYFRSDFRRGVQLYEEDLALARQFFSHPTQVFLIVRVDQEMTPDAGFFSGMVERSSVKHPSCSFLSMSDCFQRRKSRPQRPSHRPSSRSAGKPASPTASCQTRASEGPPRSKTPYLIGGLVVALIAGGYALFPYLLPYLRRPAEAPNNLNRPTRQSVSSPTLLSVSQLDKNVEVTWDSQLPAFSDARIGVLTIKDGDWQVELPLTKVQLQMNKLIYPPKTDQLEITWKSFRLPENRPEATMFLDSQRSVEIGRGHSAHGSQTESRRTCSGSQIRKRTGLMTPEASAAPVRTFQARLVPRPKAAEPTVVTEAPPTAQISLNGAGLKAPGVSPTFAPAAATEVRGASRKYSASGTGRHCRPATQADTASEANRPAERDRDAETDGRCPGSGVCEPNR